MKKQIVSAVLAAAMVFSLAACGGDSKETAAVTTAASAETTAAAAEESKAEEAADGLSKEYSFNVGSSSTAGTTITKTFEKVQAEAPEVSGGKLKMDYFGASSLGSDKEMLTECMAGNLPIVVMTTASMTGSVPELALFDMHCAFSSMDTLSQLMEDPGFMAEVQGWFEKAGLKLIAWETQSSKLLASTTAIESISDFQGYDMRTLSNKYHIAFWQAVGANTIQIDASELYLSVQQGLIQGIEMNMASILSRKLPEVCPYVVETMDLPHMTMAVMSLDVYNSMTPEDQAWFDNYVASVNETFNSIAVEDNAGGWKTCEDGGATPMYFNEQLFADMKAIAEESSWKLVREELGDEIVDTYLGYIEAIEGK